MILQMTFVLLLGPIFPLGEYFLKILLGSCLGSSAGWVGWTLSSNHNILALVVSGYQIYGTTGLAEMFGFFSDILYQILLLALLSFKALESTPSNILLPLCFTQLHGCWNLLSSERNYCTYFLQGILGLSSYGHKSS